MKKKTVLTVGNFDGVHRGHQKLIQEAIRISIRESITPKVVVLEPHSKEFLKEKMSEISRITKFKDKAILIKSFGIKDIIRLNFNKNLAMTDENKFIKEVLVKRFKMKHLVIGCDFRFGKNKKGNAISVKEMGEKYDFKVTVVNPILFENKKISSSEIRALIKNNDFERNKKLLGHSLCISGYVHYGQRRGREIGFPTANIKIHKNLVFSGVYMTRTIIDGEVYYGISNIGSRPTFNGKYRLLENHIFLFSGDLYGKFINIEIVKFIREERKFFNWNELNHQIKKDKKKANYWIQHST